MASHGLTDITATVTVPKSEYEDLIRTAEQMKISKRILEFVDDEAPCVILKEVLGIEGKSKDETKNTSDDVDDGGFEF